MVSNHFFSLSLSIFSLLLHYSCLSEGYQGLILEEMKICCEEKKNLLTDFVIKWLLKSCSPGPERFGFMSMIMLWRIWWFHWKMEKIEMSVHWSSHPRNGYDWSHCHLLTWSLIQAPILMRSIIYYASFTIISIEKMIEIRTQPNLIF